MNESPKRGAIVKLQAIPDELLALMAEKFRMLSDPTRLAILRCLTDRQELNVSQIVRLSGRELANVSKHLKQMASTGLVARRKQSPFVLYRLEDPVVDKLCELVCDSLRRELKAEVRWNRKLLMKGERK